MAVLLSSLSRVTKIDQIHNMVPHEATAKPELLFNNKSTSIIVVQLSSLGKKQKCTA
jgi:hypothetical protein